MAGKRKAPCDLSENPSTKRVRARVAAMSDAQRQVHRAVSTLNVQISRARAAFRKSDEYALADDEMRKRREQQIAEEIAQKRYTAGTHPDQIQAALGNAEMPGDPSEITDQYFTAQEWEQHNPEEYEQFTRLAEKQDRIRVFKFEGGIPHILQDMIRLPDIKASDSDAKWLNHLTKAIRQHAQDCKRDIKSLRLALPPSTTPLPVFCRTTIATLRQLHSQLPDTSALFSTDLARKKIRLQNHAL